MWFDEFPIQALSGTYAFMFKANLRMSHKAWAFRARIRRVFLRDPKMGVKLVDVFNRSIGPMAIDHIHWSNVDGIEWGSPSWLRMGMDKTLYPHSLSPLGQGLGKIAISNKH
nr:hypothetical protein Iba_chr10bCG5510 [Ipomoea batatas]